MAPGQNFMLSALQAIAPQPPCRIVRAACYPQGHKETVMLRIATIPETDRRSWNGVRVHAFASRRFPEAPDAPAVGVVGWLRVLPTRTRPSLFGSD
jgi:hypothetical protein